MASALFPRHVGVRLLVLACGLAGGALGGGSGSGLGSGSGSGDGPGDGSGWLPRANASFANVSLADSTLYDCGTCSPSEEALCVLAVAPRAARP